MKSKIVLPYAPILVESTRSIGYSFESALADIIDNSLGKSATVGSIVSCLCLLSADPGIYAYENGAVYDEENDLLLYKDAITRQDTDRLKSAIAENAVYVNGKGKVFEGKDAIIEKMKSIEKGRKDENLHTRGIMAKITEPQEPVEELSYGEGKRCLVLCYEEDEYSYGSIAFIDTDEDGKIKRLSISTDSRYRFELDKYYQKEDEDGEEEKFTPCTDPIEAMFIRGSINGFVKNNDEENKDKLMRAALEDPVYKAIAEEAKQFADLENEKEKQLQKVTASLFVRAYEEEIARSKGISYERPALEKDISGDKEIQPVLDEGKEDFEDALRIGKLMSKDLWVLKTYENKQEMMEVLQNSLMFIQELGRCYGQALDREE